jgi:hypothetical protein
MEMMLCRGWVPYGYGAQVWLSGYALMMLLNQRYAVQNLIQQFWICKSDSYSLFNFEMLTFRT